MKKFFKNDLFIVLSLLFIFLLFIKNTVFKTSILQASLLFFKNVFPSLFPMFIINDILMNYNFFFLLDKYYGKIGSKLFHTSKSANYAFFLSIFSGTPTNGYIVANLVRENRLTKKDAGIILSYAFFLNPLFLYNMLNTIFNNQQITIKLMLINYSINFLIAFFLRSYPYEDTPSIPFQEPEDFTKVLAKSIMKSFNTLTMILGTIIFYFILCEGINVFIHHAFLNTFINGLLEATGGLSKLISLNISLQAKEFLALLFISFGGFSIHTQIKNIISDVSIPYQYLFFSRLVHLFLSTCCFIITTCI